MSKINRYNDRKVLIECNTNNTNKLSDNKKSGDNTWLKEYNKEKLLLLKDVLRNINEQSSTIEQLNNLFTNEFFTYAKIVLDRLEYKFQSGGK